jgi:1-pyrroline-5-carboxylate dehydrogenase
MASGIVSVPEPINEPIQPYSSGTSEKTSLKKRLQEMMDEQVEVPVIVGGEEIRTGKTTTAVCPHDHGHVLAEVHQAGPEEVNRAVEAAAAAWTEWSEMDWEARAAVFLKAADLLAGPWRDTLNAATMLDQSKTVFQAEIDSACELVDFWRFNPYYMRRLYSDQPGSAPGIWDYVEYRALEGFVFAVTPFNFTSIAGNLPTAPALMGNTVLWKPASTSLLSGYYIMKLLEAAGLPAGVINFLPGKGAQVGDPVLVRPELAGIHFTGSTSTFQAMWRQVGENLASYNTYPRIVGETGGKDFVFAHPSADVKALGTALVRGAFEYQGQKCSLARGAKRVGAGCGAHPHGIAPRLSQFHVCRNRREGVRQRHELHRARDGLDRIRGHLRRQRGQIRRLLLGAHGRSFGGSTIQAHAGGDFRTHSHHLCLRR